MNSMEYLATLVQSLCSQLRNKPDLSLGIDVGPHFVLLCEQFANVCLAENIDCTHMHIFGLSEYIGIPPEHGHSFQSAIRSSLVSLLKIPEDNLHFPQADNPCSDSPIVSTHVTPYKQYSNECRMAQQVSCCKFQEALKSHGGGDIAILDTYTDGVSLFSEPGYDVICGMRKIHIPQYMFECCDRAFGNTSSPASILVCGQELLLGFKKIAVLMSGAVSARTGNSAPTALSGILSVLSQHNSITLYYSAEEHDSSTDDPVCVAPTSAKTLLDKDTLSLHGYN